MAYHRIDIYLYEHMLVEAMAAIDRSPYNPDLGRVIQATRGIPGLGHQTLQAAGRKHHGRRQGKEL